ncbi:MAG: neutral zinc metallopeptidase, partial [Propionibacteriales bacterium]|nr:neutral zinc metallopeptidase [Propionibacteriales bacterium]
PTSRPATATSPDSPATRRPRRRSRVGVALAAGGMALVLIGVASAVALVAPRLRGADESAPPAPSIVVRTPSASPTPTDYTALLIDHPFNSQELGRWSCEVSVTAPRRQQALDRWVGTIVDCLDKRFAEPMEQAGYKAATPRRKFFSGDVATDCGESKAAAFYCSADETIYLDADEIGNYVDTMRLGAFHVIFHEYVHHVQQRVGIMRASQDFTPDRGKRQVTVRRLELQADCMYVSSLRRMRQAQWSAADAAELIDWRSTAGDDTHGLASTQKKWLKAGIESDSMSACNTWNVDRTEVA